MILDEDIDPENCKSKKYRKIIKIALLGRGTPYFGIFRRGYARKDPGNEEISMCVKFQRPTPKIEKVTALYFFFLKSDKIVGGGWARALIQKLWVRT